MKIQLGNLSFKEHFMRLWRKGFPYDIALATCVFVCFVGFLLSLIGLLTPVLGPAGAFMAVVFGIAGVIITTITLKIFLD